MKQIILKVVLNLYVNITVYFSSIYWDRPLIGVLGLYNPSLMIISLVDKK